ncbi:MAG: NAD(P)/FAD-dependent oxidoreductase [Chloroflexi bacterium]|nr:NAD(P)/FAD-dependent oxidoreductase [Chloroflexota bacterium]
MTKSYDVIVIGAGHNGLVTAAYLAKAGRKVLVLERREIVGGAAVTEEVFPGFKFDTLAHFASLRPEIARDLGVNVDYVGGASGVFTPLPDGGHLLLDNGRSAESIGKFSKSDAEKYPKFIALMKRFAAFLAEAQAMAPPHAPNPQAGELLPLAGLGLKLKGLGDKDMIDLLRALPVSVAELLDDWFETDALKGTLGAQGIIGLTQGPMAAGTSYVMLHHLALQNGLTHSGVVRGGIGKLTEALAGAAKGFGAEIRTGAEVAQIAVKDDRATGVVLASGEEIAAKIVVSNADPRRTFIGLVGAINLDTDFVRSVCNIKYRGASAKVNLALDGLPQLSGVSGDSHLRGRISVSPSLIYLEKAYDDAKYGGVSQKPYLEVAIPSIADPSLAPTGNHVMSIYAQYAPYHLKGGWNDRKREELGRRVVETLSEYAASLPSLILHSQVLTPLDLENTYDLTEGNANHGEMMLDQLFVMRPVPGWAQYRTPVDGLYLCGAGTHPGGGVSGLPGRNAAREILKDARGNA